MFIDKITYQRTFNLGNYSSEKIGVEVSINQGESATEALDVARKLVEEYHKENLDKILSEEEPVVQLKANDEFKTPEEHILSSDTMEELKSWELFVKTKPELQIFYNKRLEYLKIKKQNNGL